MFAQGRDLLAQISQVGALRRLSKTDLARVSERRMRSIYDDAISLINEPIEERREEAISAVEIARKRWRMIKRELRELKEPTK
jgi:hypothetical protein